MKKITIFIPYMTGFGGTETVITNLFSEYNRSDQTAQLSLVNIGGFEDGTWLDGVTDKKIIWLSRKKWLRKLQYLTLLPMILFQQVRQNPEMEIAISTNPVMWYLLALIKKLLRRNYKVVSWYHYSLSSKKVANFMLQSADEHLAISTGIADQISATGVAKERVKTIFNPILKKSLTVQRTSSNAKCRFIYVGRVMLDGQKNLRTIFDCLAQVHGNWELEVIGNGYDQAMQTYLIDLGIKSRVHFTGFKNDAWSELVDADCLLMASKYEGLPMVLNEAISVGIPVLSYDCPTGPRDIINDQNGVLVPNSDTKAYVKELQKFIDRQHQFDNISEIKNSIQKFYSENYFSTFINSLTEIKPKGE